MKPLLALTYLSGLILTSLSLTTFASDVQPSAQTNALSAQERIVNGQVLSASQAPYMGLVALDFNDEVPSNVQIICSASFLNETYVLTAAHCVYPQSQTDIQTNIRLMVINNVNSIERDIFRTSLRHYVEAIYIPTNYQEKNPFDNDIAILKLAEPALNVSEFIGLADISDESNYRKEDSVFQVLGYGLQQNNPNQTSDALRFARMDYMDQEKCRQNSGIDLSDSQICTTASPVNGLRSGPCSGDSGGPLIADLRHGAVQIGVVSFGPELCGDPDALYQSVYTEVADFSDWIAGVMQQSSVAQDSLVQFISPEQREDLIGVSAGADQIDDTTEDTESIDAPQEVTSTEATPSSTSSGGGGGSFGIASILVLGFACIRKRFNK